MKAFLGMILLAGLVACENGATVETELDSAVTRVKNSETLDSIEAKGEQILDSVKSKGGELINIAEKKIDDLKKKDTSK